MRVQTIREGWMLSTWERELPIEGNRIMPRRRAELAAKIADASDGSGVRLSAGELRKLLAAYDRPYERGARIEGTGENAGVIYLATIDAERPGRLRTVEVIATDHPPDPKAFRVPVRLLEDLTRYVLTMQDEVTADDPRDVVFVEWDVPRDGIPTPEALHELQTQGVTAGGIGKLYSRSETRVFQWLRSARQERPDLDWPLPTRGPRPKTTDGK